jgi:hypothetical protein
MKFNQNNLLGPRPGGGCAMNNRTIGRDQSKEDDLLIYEISDEALECAGETKRAGNYTQFFCTALDLCPGP